MATETIVLLPLLSECDRIRLRQMRSLSPDRAIASVSRDDRLLASAIALVVTKCDRFCGDNSPNAET
ncbi:hypothetical protein [Nostoc sp.]